MKSLVFIIPFFGKWPLWFDAHLLSIKANPTIDWLFYTDCEIPEYAPSNCTFIKSSLQEMEVLFSDKIGVPIHLDKPYKLCDLKPSYGHVFQEKIKEYDFWGFTDIDIIWGAIRKELDHRLLDDFDIISSRIGLISGHFNLFRNEESINKLYRKNDWYKQSFANRDMKRFCEGTFSDITKEALKENSVKVMWDRILCNQEKGYDSRQEYYLDKWIWKDGRVLEIERGKPINEVIYFHFINWKRTIKLNDVHYLDDPPEFYISYEGMHYLPHSPFNIVLNDLKNIVNGYWINDKRRIRKHRINSFKKRLKRRLKLLKGNIDFS